MTSRSVSGGKEKDLPEVTMNVVEKLKETVTKEAKMPSLSERGKGR